MSRCPPAHEAFFFGLFDILFFLFSFCRNVRYCVQITELIMGNRVMQNNIWIDYECSTYVNFIGKKSTFLYQSILSMPVLHLLKNTSHVIKSWIICTSEILKGKWMHLYKRFSFASSSNWKWKEKEKQNKTGYNNKRLNFLWSKPRELTIHVTGSATVESQQGSSSF